MFCSVFGIDRTPNTAHSASMVLSERQQDAVEALVDAVESLGLRARVGPDRGSDVVIVFPDGTSTIFQVTWAALVTRDSVPGQLQRWSTTPNGDMSGVVVADRITADARDHLSRAGWSWLDRRGHLRLVRPGLFVDADVPVSALSRSAPHGINGRVGIELAALLLLDPTQKIGVRAAATTLSRAPSSISDAFAALRTAALVGEDHHPAIPGLFWELVEHWKPVSRDVASIPEPANGRDNAALRLGLEDVESTVGWALSDTVAASAYGAPISIRAGHPRDFYVPDQGTLRRATQLLGPAATASSRAGRVRVAPVSLVCARRVDATTWTDEHWPLADPLFVALDLAQDPGRGREILDAWTPQEPGRRVW
jgi:hypothetical protein